MKRIVACMAMATIIAASTSSAAATEEIRVVGDASGSVEFSVADRTTLGDLEAARQPAGTTAGGYVGYYIQQVPELHAVAGFVTFPGVDDVFGAPVVVSLVPGQRAAVLEPSRRYRLTLLADGPSTAVIPTSGRGLTMRPAVPVETFFTGAVELPSTGLATRAFTTELGRGSLVLQVAAERHASAGARSREMCIVPVGTTTCGRVAPPEPLVPGLSPDAAAYGALTLPGMVTEPGPYDLLYRLTSVDPGGRHVVVGLVLDSSQEVATPPDTTSPPAAAPASTPAPTAPSAELPASGAGVPVEVATAAVLIGLALCLAVRGRRPA